MKTEAVRIHETGGADKMRREEITLSSPAADEALVRHEAIGVNLMMSITEPVYTPSLAGVWA